MSDGEREQLADLLRQAETAVTNARHRARLRGESVELAIASERLAEANRIIGGPLAQEPAAS